ncbi:hypothetical protein GCM10009839_42870 [Catenulispora yoronensis]|uniref:Uncharacterized protein n=1 Tax=Catenulispora yoronensis TaxID=450799 RepID=A0ABN2UH68_9ACTN
MGRGRGDFGLWTACLAGVWLTVAGLIAVALVGWAPAAGAGTSAAAAGVTAPTAPTAPAVPGAAPTAATPAPPSHYEAVRDQVVAKLDETDPAQALALLQQIVDDHPDISRICHPIAHDLGHAALEKYAYDFKKAISFQDGVCGNGYLHGVVEHAVLHAPDPEQALHTLCAPELDGSCLHGIGHGAMFVADMDLPKALSFCDWFGQPGQRTACAEGVFMQNFEVDVPGVKNSSWLRASDPMYPCAQQAARYQGPCYYYAPQYYLSIHADQYADGLKWCRTAANTSAVASCTMGLGSRIMKYNIDQVAFSEAQCATETDRALRDVCVRGLTSYYMVHFNDPKAGMRLCVQLTAAVDVTTCKSAATAAVSSRD